MEMSGSNPPPNLPIRVPSSDMLSTTKSTSSSSVSKIIPILGKRRMSRNIDSPSNSLKHSSSISSLGLIENYSGRRLETEESCHRNIISSSEDDDDVEDEDSHEFRNDQTGSTFKFKKSFDGVFKMDTLSSPSSNKFEFTSDEESIASIGTPRKSPNVFFKKLISRNSLRPQPKSFKRVSKELQLESQPLQTEINNEAAVTLHLKDEELLLESRKYFNNEALIQHETLKKYELINRANRLWNHSSFGKTLTGGSSHNGGHTINGNDAINTANDSNEVDNNNNNTNNDLMNGNGTINSNMRPYCGESKKRKSIDINNNEVIDQASIKRRVVSTSPNLTGLNSPVLPISRRNSKLMQSASEDLEKMSI